MEKNIAWMIGVAVGISLLFGVDMVLNFVVMGFKNVWKEKKPTYIEIILQALTWYYTILYFVERNDTTVNIADDFFAILAQCFMVRNLRALRLLNELQNVEIVVEAASAIAKPIVSKFFFMYMFYYVYASLGQLIMGGRLTMTSYAENCPGCAEFYYLMNFNDYASTFVVLFQQMIVNNWWVVVDMYTSIIGSSWYIHLYFMSFWVCVVLLQLNILLAIVLEIYGAVAGEI